MRGGLCVPFTPRRMKGMLPSHRLYQKYVPYTQRLSLHTLNTLPLSSITWFSNTHPPSTKSLSQKPITTFTIPMSSIQSRAARTGRWTLHRLSGKPENDGMTVTTLIKPEYDLEANNEYLTAAIVTGIETSPELIMRSSSKLEGIDSDIRNTIQSIKDEMRADGTYEERHTCLSKIEDLETNFKKRLAQDPRIKAFERTGIEFLTHSLLSDTAERDCRCPDHLVTGSKLADLDITIITQRYGGNNSACASEFYRRGTNDPDEALSVDPLSSSFNKSKIDRYRRYKATYHDQVQSIVSRYARLPGMSKVEKAEACQEAIERMTAETPDYHNLPHLLLQPSDNYGYRGPDPGPITRGSNTYIPMNDDLQVDPKYHRKPTITE
jgi:hypothetical protein